jgi:hypothetical protein
MRRLVTHRKKLSVKKAKDARRNGRSIAFIQLDLEFSPCTGVAQCREAERVIDPASRDMGSCKKMLAEFIICLALCSPGFNRGLGGTGLYLLVAP